ncbi:hypothetical protein EVB55_181 [Rhizobium phage RHph_Y68]|uniref:Uncharacterized protein n=1 Tax=Rhizobium phage RHph_Y68 TaxID=2509787 RepID=A0A7S5R3I2_9CAUD|nr:hypothetical protein PP934_gp181 [Rhizobium phage RHph_Y68]QIG68116.1 hypothetical protein EVB55_181 [Rhizobium phage RHph_Y68]
MGYTNRIRVDKDITLELLHEYVDSVPEDEQCPCYIEGEFPSAQTGDVINNSGSYGCSGNLMRPFCHGLGKFLMERGYSCTVEIEGYFQDDITRYDAETQTISKIEEDDDEYRGGFG